MHIMLGARTALVAAALLSLLVPRVSMAASQAPDRNTLYDVSFVDRQYGWAVGNRGTVLHTEDGGDTWRAQDSTTDYVLRAVHFIDRKRGWAVGGKSRVDRIGGKGIILYTGDGGETWQVQAKGLTGYLHGVVFTDARRGWAVGEAKDNLDGAVVRTDDGGVTWVWEATGTRRSLDGIALADDGAVAVGDDGSLFRWQAPGRWERVETDPSQLHWRDVASCANRVWTVGERCWIASSADGGRTWTDQAAGLSRDLANSFDLQSVCFVDEQHGWALGAFGTLVLTTEDGGESWRPQRTGSRIPLHGVTFVDADNGWAVGDMGAILHTGDGGRTWEVQRSGADSARMLIAVAHHDDETMSHGPVIAELGDLDTSMVCVVCTTDDRDEMGLTGDVTSQESRDVANWLGIDALREWRGFQTSHDNSFDWTMAQWNAEWGDGPRELERKLVSAIRTWRPEVILTHEPTYGDYNKFGHQLTGRTATSAYASAADPEAFPEQIAEGGLEVWQAKRLYYRVRRPLSGGVHPASFQLDPNDYSIRLGSTYTYAGRRANAYYWSKGVNIAEVNPLWRSSPYKYHLARSLGDDVLADIIPDRDELMAAQRAEAGQAQRQEAEEWERFVSGLVLEAEAFLSAVDQFLESYPAHPMSSVLTLFSALYAEMRAAESNDAQAAIALHDEFGAESPDREQAYRSRLRTITLLGDSGRFEEADARRARLADEFPQLPEARDGWLAVARARLSRGDGQGAWQQYLKIPADWNPSPGEAARLHFEMGNAARLVGELEAARRHLSAAAAAADRTSVWALNASAELDLLAGRLPSAGRQLPVSRVDTAPVLDGSLDEGVWGRAVSSGDFRPERLEWFDEPQPTEVRAAYDDENLYLAAICQDSYLRTLDAETLRDSSNRLWASNYVSWVFDRDRSYLRGTEYMMPAAGPDPGEETAWRFAVQRNEDNWTVEAAIPWSEFGARPSPGEVWAVNVYRGRRAPSGGHNWTEWTAWALPYVRPRSDPWVVGYLLVQ